MSSKLKGMLVPQKSGYDWKYCSVGGVTRVNIETGEDIAHLGELDQKLWTVLSCPVKGLEFDERTLTLMDADGDGKIRVQEVVAASKWLTTVLKDPNLLLKGDDCVRLDDLADNDEGKSLCDSAKLILSKLGVEKDCISLSDVKEYMEIFEEKCRTEFQNAATDEAPYTPPYGESTEDALVAVSALKDKVADYFMRCKLIGFDEDCGDVLDVSVEKIGAISANNLTTCSDEIASYPLARPSKECALPLNGGINPAWQGTFGTLKTLVLDVDFAGKESISEADWQSVLDKMASYTTWKSEKEGAENEAINKELEIESAAIEPVDKLLHFYRDFYRLLRNYVVMSDFYRTKGEAVFQVGQLYIDQRCCELCIRVSDMSKHADMAGQSGMFLIYCTCTSKVKNQTMDIVAVLTDGDVDDLRVGKNAIFYDRDGLDWDAVITKIIDNPISIRQAFWNPYRKLGNFITEKINKSAAEKEANSMSNLTAKTDSALTSAQADMAAAQTDPNAAKAAQAAKAAEAKPAFDIAKFAGIFAAIGMALGMIGSAIMAIIKPWTNIIVLFFVLVICISGPSMFIAWSKLRKRNLGPILNANGWAINSKILVNILFGATLTSMAKYPRLDLKSMSDPFVTTETPLWKKWLCGILIVVVLVGLVIGIMFLLHKGPFAKDCNLKVQSANIEMGTVKGDGIFKDYTYDTIVALPAEGYVFVNWNGIDTLTSDTLAVYLLSDTAFVANFAPVPAPEPAPEEPAPAAE